MCREEEGVAKCGKFWELAQGDEAVGGEAEGLVGFVESEVDQACWGI